jgi:hypothetical protein
VVTKLVLDAPRSAQRPSAPPWIGAVTWLVAPLLLGAVFTAFALLRQGPEALLGPVLVAVGAVPLLWLLVSIVFPARTDRRCPECGAEALEPLREDDLQGLRCGACAYSDEHASAWKFAEEDDRPLEPLVLRQRRGALPTSLSGPSDRGAQP